MEYPNFTTRFHLTANKIKTNWLCSRIYFFRIYLPIFSNANDNNLFQKWRIIKNGKNNLRTTTNLLLKSKIKHMMR